MKTSGASSELGPFQFVILVLSLFVLALIAVELVVPVPTEVGRLMHWVDNIVCGFFLVDFVIRFREARSKLQFMKWGWIDLLASIPEIDLLRVGRLFRIFRILRLLRAARSLRLVFRILFSSRVRGGTASVGIITFLVLTLSSIGILLAETTPQSNIKTAEDALWWAVTTITTVGYGDRFPVTGAGRLIGAALMITGIGLFGTFSGVVASFFLGKKDEDESGDAAPAPDQTQPAGGAPSLHTDVAALRAEITALRVALEATTNGKHDTAAARDRTGSTPAS